MRKIIIPLIAILFSACGEINIDMKSKTIHLIDSSQVATNKIFDLAKECWENPNKKIAGVIMKGLSTGETYKTKIRQNTTVVETVISAGYDVYDVNNSLKPNQYWIPLISITISDENETSKATISSRYKSAINEVIYWIDHQRCK